MANEPPFSIYQQNLELMGSITTDHFSQRTARFLNHVTKTLDKPEPIPISNPTKQPNPNFKPWRHPPTKWAEWVDQMAGKHSAVWIESGIFDSIMSSIYEIPCNHDVISTLFQYWTPQTNTFVFPWGEATITLEDVTILGGYSVIGDSVVTAMNHDVISMPDLAGKVEVMNRFRSDLIKSKSRKASHSKWIQMFMTNTSGHEQEEKHEDEFEHIAFLSLWLSRFVFPSRDQNSVGKHVIPIAVRLSQGVKLALAPAVLAYIYDSLTKLKKQCCVNLLGPFLLVQIWGYERFPVLGPKRPNELRPGEPRLARWHSLDSNVMKGLPLLHSHMINPETFIWRPYAVDVHNWKPPLYYYQDGEHVISDLMMLDEDLRSFVCFIACCELNGIDCKAAYNPHRVAMQFGFDQDIPGDVSGYKSCKLGKLFVPSRLFQPGVSKRYYDWWKNVDRTGCEKGQDSSLGERVNASVECGKRCDFEFVDLSGEDEVDDILVTLKKICSDTKRKIDSLKGSYVGGSQSKRGKLGRKLGNEAIDVIIID